jgi:hypothetical protein
MRLGQEKQVMFGKALLEMTEEKVSGIAERISNLLQAARTNQMLD